MRLKEKLTKSQDYRVKNEQSSNCDCIQYIPLTTQENTQDKEGTVPCL